MPAYPKRRGKPQKAIWLYDPASRLQPAPQVASSWPVDLRDVLRQCQRDPGDLCGRNSTARAPTRKSPEAGIKPRSTTTVHLDRLTFGRICQSASVVEAPRWFTCPFFPAPAIGAGHERRHVCPEAADAEMPVRHPRRAWQRATSLVWMFESLASSWSRRGQSAPART
jgi:hypothetical protein